MFLNINRNLKWLNMDKYFLHFVYVCIGWERLFPHFGAGSKSGSCLQTHTEHTLTYKLRWISNNGNYPWRNSKIMTYYSMTYYQYNLINHTYTSSKRCKSWSYLLRKKKKRKKDVCSFLHVSCLFLITRCTRVILRHIPRIPVPVTELHVRRSSMDDFAKYITLNIQKTNKQPRKNL